jgi:amino acid transporter
MGGWVLTAPVAAVPPASGNTLGYVAFFIVLALWIVTIIGLFTFLTGKAAKHLPSWIVLCALVVVGVLGVVWLMTGAGLWIVLAIVAIGAFYIFHFLRLATKPGEALTNLVSTDVRRDEAAAYAAGEVPDPEADRAESRERGSALDDVLGEMEHEAGHEVPAEDEDV